jgi:hypothetical protein
VEPPPPGPCPIPGKLLAVRDDAKAKIPFWIHQIVEYGIGALLAYQAIHSPQPMVPLLAGLVVVLLAATAEAPAACFHVVSRPLHRVLDLLVAAALLVAAIVLGDQAGDAGRLMLILGALALGVLTLRSDYRSRAARRARATTEPSQVGSARAEEIGRSAGRIVGRSVQEYRKRRSGTKSS